MLGRFLASARAPLSRCLSSGPIGAFVPNVNVMLPPGTFKGKVALVTGGGTGLGKGMAQTLSQLGATVCISSRKADVINATAEELTKATGNQVGGGCGS